MNRHFFRGPISSRPKHDRSWVQGKQTAISSEEPSDGAGSGARTAGSVTGMNEALKWQLVLAPAELQSHTEWW